MNHYTLALLVIAFSGPAYVIGRWICDYADQSRL